MERRRDDCDESRQTADTSRAGERSMNPVGAGGGAQIQFARDVCDKVRVWDVVGQYQA